MCLLIRRLQKKPFWKVLFTLKRFNMSKQGKMVKTKCRCSLRCFHCYFFSLFSAVVIDCLSAGCTFLAIFFVCSVGEPGEERAQGPGSTAGVWREGSFVGEPRLLGQFSRGVIVEIFYNQTWYLRIPLIKHHLNTSAVDILLLGSSKADGDNITVPNHISA